MRVHILEDLLEFDVDVLIVRWLSVSLRAVESA